MKRERGNSYLIFIIGIFFLLIFIPIVSAALIDNIKEYFRDLFTVGNDKIDGNIGELYNGPTDDNNSILVNPPADIGWCEGADINHNGVVDTSDYIVWRGNKGCISNTTTNWCNYADVNRDGIVDDSDGILSRAKFGYSNCVSAESNTTIICSSNSECPSDGFVGNTFCIGNDAYRDYRINACINPGTSDSFCAFRADSRLIESCGSGTSCSNGNCVPLNTIQISNCQELQAIQNNLSANYSLITNIDCSATVSWNNGLGFKPIGSSSSPFRGNLNGNNNTILNLYINRPSENYVGLFSYNYKSKIYNIEIVDVNIIGLSYIGGFVGYNNYSDISNSYSNGNVSGTSYIGGLTGYNGNSNISSSYSNVKVSGGDRNVGGIAGVNYYGNIKTSYSSGNANAVNQVGGIAGYNYYSNISNSYSNVKISGSGINIGGLAGINEYGNIFSSYSSGNVSGTVSSSQMGGLVGSNSNGKINNSFSTGYVNNPSGGQIGGLLGSNSLGGVYNSYWNSFPGTALNCYFGGNVGCTKIQDNLSYFRGDVYPNKQPFASWDFSNIWDERTNNYPSLKWQGLGSGGVVCDSNFQCGINFNSSFYCSGNSVYLNSTNYVCNNPGTTSSFCSSLVNSPLIQTCGAGQVCSNGACVPIGSNLNLSIDIATKKDIYSVGEKIELK